MTTILDLPIHPLAVHAPVILVPLLALFGMVYLFIPPLRRFVGWVVAALTLIAPAAAYGSIWSGEELADFLYPDGWPQTVIDHRSYGYRLLWILIGLIPVWWLFAGLERGRRSAVARNGGGEAADDDESSTSGGADPAASGRRVAMFIVGLIAFILLGLAAWMVFMSGHSGSDMRWGGLVG
ncbi:hypothetical protein L0U85_10410 [Glycomyces sp. L485]|uniref:hypothetical protein n=1 Tax=Glycomyces sp. L485 TaxID=2909235 RepID=UPI001F4B4C86|nr:hypothetical protein [Glycomyces sp. L485]MCH7231261.1 hypothetical protein [Glycomyces sp. L485]